jgi:hypothetical protein
VKRSGSILLVFAVLWVTLAGTALAWEKGTHAYIADLLRKKGGAQNVEEMYAAMAPDSFNYLFAFPGLAYRDWLYAQTHFDFMKVQAAAKTATDRSAGAGFLSHNNVWGADSTAHTDSLTLVDGEGYIITKAKALHQLLLGNSAYASYFGDPTVYPIAIEICHNLVEAEGDVILKQYDPDLGRKLLFLVNRPKPTIQNLMVKAYAADLAQFSSLTLYPISTVVAAGFIAQAETEFRMGSIGYGYLLLGDDATLIANIVDQFKALAGAFLSAYGLPVPDEATLTDLITGGLSGAWYLCAGDYMTEVNATVDFVAAGLKSHKIK